MRETELYKENPAMFRNDPLGFVLVLILCAVGIGFVFLIVWWIRIKGTLLTVTSERTILRKGLLSKSLNEVWHRDVRNVQLEQRPVQRLFGVGRIAISSAGQDGVEIAVDGVRDPERIKGIIDAHKLRTLPGRAADHPR